MLLLLTLLGKEVLPLGTEPGTVLTTPPLVQRTELSPTLPPTLSSLQTLFPLLSSNSSAELTALLSDLCSSTLPQPTSLLAQCMPLLDSWI